MERNLQLCRERSGNLDPFSAQYNMRRLLVVLAVVVGLYGVSFVRDSILSLSEAGVMSGRDFPILIYKVLFTAVVLISVAFVILRIFPFPAESAALLWKSAALGLCAGIASASMQWFFALYFMNYGGIEKASQTYLLVWGGEGKVDFLLLVMSIGLMTPLVEELLFRGVIHRSLSAVLPRGHAILLSSVVFACFHSEIQVIPAFAVGLFAALFYERTARLWPGIMLHMGLNIGFVVVLFGGAAGRGQGVLAYGAVPVAIPAVLFLVTLALAVLVYFRLPRRPEVADFSVHVTIPGTVGSKDIVKGHPDEGSTGPG